MKESILNKQASYFNNHSDTYPKPISVLEFLTDQSGIKLQNDILSCVDDADKKELKAEAKCIAISGTFSKRGEIGLIKHSGLIAIDIDLKDNTEILKDPNFFKGVCSLEWIAYFGKSISGNGYFGIIPISNPSKHKEHFEAIKEVFKSMGIVLDDAPKNVASLRYQSYDTGAYYDHNAKLFAFVKELSREPKNGTQSEADKTAYATNAENSTSADPFKDYNLNGNIPDLLISKGWKIARSGKSDNQRFTRPGKTKGVSADWHVIKRTLFLFSSDPSTGLETAMKGYSPSTVFMQLEGCKSTKEAARKLYDLGYGKG